MIELRIRIKETEKIETKNGQASRIDIEYEASRKKYTPKEMEVLEMFEDKLDLHRKTQIINKCINSKTYEELLEKMLSSI